MKFYILIFLFLLVVPYKILAQNEDEIIVAHVDRDGRDVVSVTGDLPTWAPGCYYGLHILYPGGNTEVITMSHFDNSESIVEFVVPTSHKDWHQGGSPRHLAVVQRCPNLIGFTIDAIAVSEPEGSLPWLVSLVAGLAWINKK